MEKKLRRTGKDKEKEGNHQRRELRIKKLSRIPPLGGRDQKG